MTLKARQVSSLKTARYTQHVFVIVEDIKLITLNVWGGRKESKLHDFFIQHNNEVYIFCLQEVNYEAEGKNDNFPEDHYGLASFVHDDDSVLSAGDSFVSGFDSLPDSRPS